MFFNEFDNPPSLVEILIALIIIGLFILGIIFGDRALIGLSVGLIIGALLYEWRRNKKPHTWPLTTLIGKFDKSNKLLSPDEFRKELNESKWGLSGVSITEALRTNTCIICGGNLVEKEKGDLKRGGQIKGKSCTSCQYFYSL